MTTTASTRDLSPLPDVEGLRRTLQSMAMLDAVLCVEWALRYYSFNSRWRARETMGAMHNGSGDEFFALFNSAGCFLKGFAHEAAMTPYRQQPPQTWPGLFDSVPAEFADCLQEPAFDIPSTTFCIWRSFHDAEWQRGDMQFPDHPDPDGSEYLLSPLAAGPAGYATWASEYYGEAWDESFTLPLWAVQAVYDHLPLNPDLIAELNPDRDASDARRDATEIGYPVAF